MEETKEKEKVIKQTFCFICGGSNLVPFLSLGIQALSNSFLLEEELSEIEFKAPLEVCFCEDCGLVQLLHIVDREYIFKKYAYFTSTSPDAVEHFRLYAGEIMREYPKQAMKLTFEIASNDGAFLLPCSKTGAKVLGIDPAVNVTEVARRRGIETIQEFFTSNLVPGLIETYGKAGIIVANNVLAHTDNLHDIISGVKQFLDDDGVFVFEVQYLLDLIQKNEFDNIYHEHTCYFSLRPLQYLLYKHGLRIFNVKSVDTQGGSIRVYASHNSSIYNEQPSVRNYLTMENIEGLNTQERYIKFSESPLVGGDTLRYLLLELKRQGKKVVGYGAPAKGNTLLQCAGITNNEISYIVDSAPSKQRKYTPGTRIPITYPGKLKEDVPDYILILAWNYASSIMEKEKWFSEQGGKFIIPIPEFKII